ncbi:MAG: L-seryl-tRNA(Sec) selenium transferase [bacterium]
MNKQIKLRSIPSVDVLLNKPYIEKLVSVYSRKMVLYCIRNVLTQMRSEIQKKKDLSDICLSESIEQRIRKSLHAQAQVGIRKIVNGTGIILSTNLGRAVLAKQAVEALSQLSEYSSLEVDLATGGRGRRWLQIENLLQVITGAQAAALVNNNAAATMLILNTFAKGKEVIVSRGQLVEIGGSFRLPDVMAQSGCILIEVGATNRTHLRDYERAINDNTALLFRVHTSNYKIKGFTSEVSLKELVALGKKKKIPVVDDIGSGALTDLARFGFKEEPQVQSSIKHGADLVCFSADKLLGGSQGGIILGKRKYIDKIRKNPLSRALRLGKLSLTVLEAALRLYLHEDTIDQHIPVLKMLKVPVEELAQRADALAHALPQLCSGISVQVKDGFSQVGGGSLSEENIPTKVLRIQVKGLSAAECAQRLRSHTIPVLTRIKNNHVIIDMRTILENDTIIKEAFNSLLS